jgi:hypothetical protein
MTSFRMDEMPERVSMFSASDTGLSLPLDASALKDYCSS